MNTHWRRRVRGLVRRLRRNPRVWPIIRSGLEMIVVFAALLWVDAAFFEGDRFSALDSHPFGVAALVFAAHYGVTSGVAAVALAALATLVGVAPPSAPGQDFYDQAVQMIAAPTLWLLAAVLFGSLRSMHRAREVQALERRDDAEAAAVELSRALDTAVKEISRLEGRIASETATVDGLLSALAPLSSADAQTFAERAGAFVGDICGAAALSFYAFDARGLRFIGGVDETGAAPSPDAIWAHRSDIVARLRALRGPVLADDAAAFKDVAPQGVAAVATIPGCGVLVVERARPGATLRAERLQLAATTLAALWPLQRQLRNVEDYAA